MRQRVRRGNLLGGCLERGICAVVKSLLSLKFRRVKAAYCIGGALAIYILEADLASVAQDMLHRRDTYRDSVVITTSSAKRNGFFLFF